MWIICGSFSWQFFRDYQLFVVGMDGGHGNVSYLMQFVVALVKSVTRERFLIKSEKCCWKEMEILAKAKAEWMESGKEWNMWQSYCSIKWNAIYACNMCNWGIFFWRSCIFVAMAQPGFHFSQGRPKSTILTKKVKSIKTGQKIKLPPPNFFHNYTENFQPQWKLLLATTPPANAIPHTQNHTKLHSNTTKPLTNARPPIHTLSSIHYHLHYHCFSTAFSHLQILPKQ